ncbi:MAG: hypothetical protein OXI10_06890 [Gammaproteobacteria bacterium]|nr:hypothetical protein [Gammaproteobacteria bacterium]
MPVLPWDEYWPPRFRLRVSPPHRPLHVLLTAFVGALFLALCLSSPAQAAKIIPQEHWDRCISPLSITDADLIAEMRRQAPPLVTEANSRGVPYYLDFSNVEEDCGPWIWKVMGNPLVGLTGKKQRGWKVYLKKFFYHFKQGEIPGLDDHEALRHETCPGPLDRRMQYPYGIRIVVAHDEDGNVTDEFVGALGDPRCALLDEVEQQN